VVLAVGVEVAAGAGAAVGVVTKLYRSVKIQAQQSMQLTSWMWKPRWALASRFSIWAS
jgi:hypothetical protein